MPERLCKWLLLVFLTDHIASWFRNAGGGFALMTMEKMVVKFKYPECF